MKVNDAERFEGEANPDFTSSLESAVDASGVKVEYACDADESSPAGEYQIGATVSDPNFDAEVVPGTLTVKKKQEPVDPDPVVPDPDNPDPDNPEPGPKPDPDNPDPDKPDPDNPDKPVSYEVTVKAVNGSVDNCSVTVAAGEDVTLSAKPDEDCYLERVTVTEAGSDKPFDVDISDYVGGVYEITLVGVVVSQEVTFEFAKADAPRVIAQPQDASVHEGDSAVLSVTAEAGEVVLDHAESSTGSAADVELFYQWFRMVDGEAVALEGETGETLVVEDVDDDRVGEYFCRVTQRYLGTETQADSDHADISIAPRDALVFNGGLLPTAHAHSAYRATIAGAAGGKAPYEYAWDEEKLPDGFKLSRMSGGLTLSGTPSKAGVYSFDVTCTDAQGETVTAHFVLVVQAKQEPVDPDPVEPSPDKPDGPDPDQPDKPGAPDSDQSDSKDPAKPGSSDGSAADKANANDAENSGKKASSKTSTQRLVDMGDRAPLAVAVAAGAVALVALGLELLRRRRSDA